MATDLGNIYQWIPLYLEQLSWLRKLLARHFEVFKVSEKEYMDWLYKRNNLT